MGHHSGPAICLLPHHADAPPPPADHPDRAMHGSDVRWAIPAASTGCLNIRNSRLPPPAPPPLRPHQARTAPPRNRFVGLSSAAAASSVASKLRFPEDMASRGSPSGPSGVEG